LFKSRSRSAAQNPRTRARLGLEAMEARDVPAVFAFPASGQLVVGTTASTDTVTLDHVVINNAPFTEVNGIIFADSSITNGIHIQSGFQTVDILATSKPVTFDGGATTVNVGKAGSMQGILAPVSIGASQKVTLDDSNDPTGQNVTVDNPNGVTTVTGLARSATISLTDASGTVALQHFAIKGGSGANTFNILNTPNAVLLSSDPGTVTRLDTGTGNDTINVKGTSSFDLDIEGQSGFDQVHIGNNGSLLGIRGFVDVDGDQGNSIASVTVDGSADTNHLDLFIGPDASLPGSFGISGLSPVTVSGVTSFDNNITYNAARTSFVDFKDGSGGNPIEIADTIPNGTTEIDAGTSNDSIFVDNTTGQLNLTSQGGADLVNIGNGGGLLGIQGNIHISNTPNFSTLVLDGSADLVNRTFDLSAQPGLGLIQGVGGAVITYVPSDVSQVTLIGGQGHETFLVRSTFDTPVTIDGFGQSAAFIVGNFNNSLDDLRAPLTLQGGAGVDTITINDTGAATGHFYSDNATQFRRDDGVIINHPGIGLGSIQLNPSPKPIPLTFGPDPFFPAATNLALTSSIRAGQSATLTGQLTDGDPNQVLSLTVNWGDGTPVQQSTPNRAPFDLVHEYDAPGTYTVLVTWSDQRGRHNERKMTVTVQPRHHGHGEGHEGSDADGASATRPDALVQLDGTADADHEGQARARGLSAAG
jgi:hypothetical protein